MHMVRRPICYLSGAFIVGISAMAVWERGSVISLLIVVGFLVLLGINLPIGKESWPKLGPQAASILILLLLGGGFYQQESQRSFVLHELEGNIGTVTGRVIFVEEKPETTQYLTILCHEVGGVDHIPGDEKILYRVYDGEQSLVDLTGKMVQIRGKIIIPNPARNPACFDYRKYLRSRGIGTLMDGKLTDIQVVKENLGSDFRKGIFRTMNQAAISKKLFLNRLQMNLNDKQYGLAAGMLFGDKNQMDEDLLGMFQKNATAHLLAVSGLHVGLFYMFMRFFARIFQRDHSLIWNVLILTVLFIYGFLSAFSPSVVRALTMIVLHVACRFLYLRFDLLSATMFSGSLFLLFQPMMVHNVGFQLSYVALLSMAFLIPVFEKHVRIPGVKGWSPLLAIQLGLTPLIAYYFNHMSWVGILANLPSVLLAGFILPVLMVLFPVSFLGDGILFTFLVKAVGWGMDGLIWLNQWLYWEGKTTFWCISPPPFLMAGFILLLFVVFSESAKILRSRGYHSWLIKTSIMLLILIVFAQGIYKVPLRDCDMVFLDVGQGDCLFMETPGGYTVMIDSGGSENYDVGRKVLLPYLLKNGHRKIDLAVVTHLHQDHYGGFQTLSQEIPIQQLVLYEGYESMEDSIVDHSGFDQGQLTYVSKGSEIRVEDQVKIRVLSPEAWSDKEDLLPEDENQLSLILRVEVKGVAVLMTGDIDEEGERFLMRGHKNDILQHDILKIAHHGSRFSTGKEFLRMVRPTLAVIQVGKNNFGHPHPTVIEKCREQDIMVLRNDWHGAIGIKIPKGKSGAIWAKTMLSNE